MQAYYSDAESPESGSGRRLRSLHCSCNVLLLRSNKWDDVAQAFEKVLTVCFESAASWLASVCHCMHADVRYQCLRQPAGAFGAWGPTAKRLTRDISFIPRGGGDAFHTFLISSKRGGLSRPYVRYKMSVY